LTITWHSVKDPICSAIKALTPPSAGALSRVICALGTAACAGMRRFAGGG
jgi:hypothetical protein